MSGPERKEKSEAIKRMTVEDLARMEAPSVNSEIAARFLGGTPYGTRYRIHCCGHYETRQHALYELIS